jgi:hypothetical protein
MARKTQDRSNWIRRDCGQTGNYVFQIKIADVMAKSVVDATGHYRETSKSSSAKRN